MHPKCIVLSVVCCQANHLSRPDQNKSSQTGRFIGISGLEKQKNKIIRDVRLSYLNVLYAKEKIKLLDKLKNIFSELSKAGEIRYETGDVSYLEKISAQAGA